jgi:hypothetical protein
LWKSLAEVDTNLPLLLLKQSQSIGKSLPNVVGFILEPDWVLLTYKNLSHARTKRQKLTAG